MYSKVSIDGNATEQSAEVSDKADAEPFWVFTKNVDVSLSPIVINIDVLDADVFPAAPDDVIDMNPVDNKMGLTIVLDLTTGNWTFGGDPIAANATSVTGDGDHEHEGTFEGGEKGQIFFDISLASTSGDADGDGLLDGVGDARLRRRRRRHHRRQPSRDGRRPAAQGSLPRARLRDRAVADPRRHPGDEGCVRAPHRSAIPTGRPASTSCRHGQSRRRERARRATASTCNDGIDNGGDGTIDGADTRLQVPRRERRGSGPTNCNDGIDNDGDGLADVNDPTASSATTLVVAARSRRGRVQPRQHLLRGQGHELQFRARRWIFRYAVSIALAGSCPKSGGWGEIGGNDFMEFNHDGGTILHELGHTLNLHHGGNEDNNCKPNYVSGMNYDNQFGIRRVGGGTIIDYSPPRIALNGSTRGARRSATSSRTTSTTAPCSTAPTTATVTCSWTRPAPRCRSASTRVRTGTATPTRRWNRIRPSTSTRRGRTAARRRCAGNGSNNDTLEGFNDWNTVSLPFRQFGDSSDGAINPDDRSQADALRLSTSSRSSTPPTCRSRSVIRPTRWRRGRNSTYTVTATNNGPSPATSVEIVNTLPTDVSFSSASASCAERSRRRVLQRRRAGRRREHLGDDHRRRSR